MKTLTLQEFFHQAQKICKTHALKGDLEVRFQLGERTQEKEKKKSNSKKLKVLFDICIMLEKGKKYEYVASGSGDTPQLALSEFESCAMRKSGKNSISTASIILNQ